MFRECPDLQRNDFSSTKDTFIINSKEQWETVPLSKDPDFQQWAVERADDASRSQDILPVLKHTGPNKAFPQDKINLLPPHSVVGASGRNILKIRLTDTNTLLKCHCLLDYTLLYMYSVE